MHTHIAEPRGKHRSSIRRCLVVSLLAFGALFWALPGSAGPSGAVNIRSDKPRSVTKAVVLSPRDLSPTGSHESASREDLEQVNRTLRDHAQLIVNTAQETASRDAGAESDRLEFDLSAQAKGLYVKTNQDGELDAGCVEDFDGNCTFPNGRAKAFLEARIDVAGEKRTIRVGDDG